jgi:co-chaperonin GroES (HSP10)
MKATGYRLLVKPEEIVKQTASGIVIEYGRNEALEKDAMTIGLVVDVGPDCWKSYPEPWAKVGDKIHWARWAGKKVVDPVSKEEFLVLNDEDVISVC